MVGGTRCSEACAELGSAAADRLGLLPAGAQEGDGDDADDGDDGHEQRVLHEGGALLGGAEAAAHVAGDEVEGAEHGILLWSVARLSRYVVACLLQTDYWWTPRVFTKS